MNELSYKTSIDIDAKTRQQMIVLLNTQLADTFDLYSQLKQAHWNVKGMQFQPVHELFDTLAGEVIGHVDTLAERVTALGGTALGTTRMTADATRLPECPTELGGSEGAVKIVIERYANVANSNRAAIKTASEADDEVTADVFTEISRDLDKGLYFLEAHLQ